MLLLVDGGESVKGAMDNGEIFLGFLEVLSVRVDIFQGRCSVD